MESERGQGKRDSFNLPADTNQSVRHVGLGEDVITDRIFLLSGGVIQFLVRASMGTLRTTSVPNMIHAHQTRTRSF
jgi:hypothetical protein